MHYIGGIARPEDQYQIPCAPKELYISWSPPFGYDVEYIYVDNDGKAHVVCESTEYSPLSVVALLLSIVAVVLRLIAA
jgi:hypothetical protein